MSDAVGRATVTVEAPNAIAARISKAVVTYNNKKSKLTAGFIGESEITLFDAEGGEIPAASVKLSENTAEVSVPVLPPVPAAGSSPSPEPDVHAVTSARLSAVAAAHVRRPRLPKKARRLFMVCASLA